MQHKLQPGQEIDGFLLEEKLHQGGMAILWRVRHRDHSQPLLMKVPRMVEGEDPASIVGFEMEMMLLPRLSGPHVPKVLAVGDFARFPYLVLEEIPGATLFPLVSQLPRGIEEIVGHVVRIADALEAIHRQHVVHLDVKPSNIMFRPSGECVLIDYGLARHAHLPDLMKEEFRLPYGTAPYMAPEQVAGIRSDPRSDLFALGVLMSFFATGVRPFGDPQTLKGLERRLWQDPVPPLGWRKDIPGWFQEIVLRCLSCNPADRPATAAQLAFDLRNRAQIALTARATRIKRDPLLVAWRRRLDLDTIRAGLRASRGHLAAQTAPIVAVALDTLDATLSLQDALRRAVEKVMAAYPGARLACLNVLKPSDQNPEDAVGTAREAPNSHIQRLIELKAWAAGLELAGARVTFHVLESGSPAAAILDFARANGVDHIVMGARANSLKRRLLGTVTAEVAAFAPCTVTVVRERQPTDEPATTDAAIPPST